MELNDLYRDVILDHNRQPRNFGDLEPADASVEGFNPMCGDRLTVRLRLNDDKISDIRFEGQGCAISTASASLMTEAVKGKTRADALRLVDAVRRIRPDAAFGADLIAGFPTESDAAFENTLAMVAEFEANIGHLRTREGMAKAMAGDRERCIQAGASDSISKPVDIDQLLSLLRIWLYEK